MKLKKQQQRLYTRVINNWSKVQTLPSFLNKMIKGNFIWLSDEKSHYPIDPADHSKIIIRFSKTIPFVHWLL